MRWTPSMPRLSATTTLLLVLGTGCSDDGLSADGSGSSSGSGSTSAADSTNGTPPDPGATSVVSGNGTTSESTSSVDPDGTSDGGMESIGFISAGSTTDAPVEPQPNGSFCGLDEECKSGHCTGIPDVGGVCSDCAVDADCEMGTCVFDFSVGYSTCTDGSVGVDCMSDEGCADGLVCADVFDAGGFGPTRCSECSPDAPCPDGQGCTLITDAGLLEAYLGCIDAATVPLGETCPVTDGVGDGTICMSGQCGVIDVFGFQIGVCSECYADDDCMAGQTCSPPGFGMGMLEPGTCG
jgi:hypothetical protein